MCFLSLLCKTKYFRTLDIPVNQPFLNRVMIEKFSKNTDRFVQCAKENKQLRDNKELRMTIRHRNDKC